MPVVGCPKCKKKFKLSSEMLGKTVRCSNCETAFKTAGQAKPPASSKPKSGDAAKKQSKRRSKPPANSAGGPTQASKSSLKDVGLSGQIKPQMDLFAQPIPSRRGPDPLGNFSLEDPGFGEVDLDADEEDDKDSTPDDKKHLFMNPALKSQATSTGKRKPKGKIKKPSGFKSIKVLGNVISVFGLIALLACGIVLVISVLGLIQKFSGQQFLPKWTVGAFAVSVIVFYVALIITYFLSLFYWPMAHSNTSVLGAQGQKFSPMWMVGSWFIPLMNLVWPMQGITEIIKASKRPEGKKWAKVKVSLWEAQVWPIATVIGSILSRVYTRNVDAGFMSKEIAALVFIASLIFMALALGCVLSLIKQTTKVQYNHFM